MGNLESTENRQRNGEIPKTFQYEPKPGTGFEAAAKFIMKNSGRKWIIQLVSNTKIVKEVSDAIEESFKGKPLQAKKVYTLGDIGTYVPRLAENSSLSTNDSKSNLPTKNIKSPVENKTPKTFQYIPAAESGFEAAAKFVIQQSRLDLKPDEYNQAVKDVTEAIGKSFKGITLKAGETYTLKDAGAYVPRLAKDPVGTKNSKLEINLQLKYFVIHDTGVNGEVLSKYNEPQRRKIFYGKVHRFLDSKGCDLEITPFDVVARGTRMDRNMNKGSGEMIHIELLLNKQERPTKEQYLKLAKIYNELTGGKASLIIVPHREVDRGVPNGHSDPRNFDFNYFYQVLKEKYNINIIPGVTGITKERYQIENDSDMVQNWPPLLSGPVIRKKL